MSDTKNIMKVFLIIIVSLLAMPLHAQLPRMQIVGAPKLLHAEFPDRRDANGRLCAVIKVVANMDGFGYDSYNGVVGAVKDRPGEDFVYLSPDERVFLLFHTGYEPLKIILSDFGISLKEKQMWVINIKGEFLDLLPVSFIITPQPTELLIDGKGMGRGPFQLNAGQHAIKIIKDNYKTIEDSITVNRNRVLFEYQLVFNNPMIFIKGGAFEMGDTFNEGGTDEKPVHTVTINSFYMSQYEVTFCEYDAFCEATGRDKPGDDGWGRGLRPVINVSWYDAVEYGNWLSRQEGLTPCYKIDKSQKDPSNKSNPDRLKWLVTCNFIANGYRLPTEAEWEYAAREGGRKVRFGNGKNIADPEEINFNDREYKMGYLVAGVSRDKTVTVGRFSPNSLGLYDMSGNVEERCWDWYDRAYYQKSPRNNPSGPSSGTYRILRGGSWTDRPNYARTAYRGYNRPHVIFINRGFRLVRTF